MAIHRAPRPDNHFTQIRNDVLRDERLSYRARGVLAVILSNTDDWTTTAEGLARQGTEGRDAIYKALQELESAGYLVRTRHQDERGRMSTRSVVYDTPRTVAPKTIQGDLFAQVAPTTDYQESVNQESVNQSSVNQESLEEHQEHPAPPGPAAPTQPASKAPADLVATAVYEAMDKLGNYIAIRQLAGKALKAGHTQEAVTAAMIGAHSEGRPLTGQVVHQRLTGAQGGTIRNTNHDHWTAGGGFAAEEGPTP